MFFLVLSKVYSSFSFILVVIGSLPIDSRENWISSNWLVDSYSRRKFLMIHLYLFSVRTKDFWEIWSVYCTMLRPKLSRQSVKTFQIQLKKVMNFASILLRKINLLKNPIYLFPSNRSVAEKKQNRAAEKKANGIKQSRRKPFMCARAYFFFNLFKRFSFSFENRMEIVAFFDFLRSFYIHQQIDLWRRQRTLQRRSDWRKQRPAPHKVQMKL